MKTFMAVYIGTPAAFENFQKQHADPGQQIALRKQGIDAWMQWGNTHRKAVIDNGGPLGKTKRISAEGVSDIRNHLTGYTLVKAESHEAAAQMFANHPHFTHFPGDSVEVMEVLPIPNL